jgi:hypothetical protein
MGSGLYPQANTGVDVGSAIEGIANAVATTREGMIRRAMMQREIARQAAADQQIQEDRLYQRTRDESTARSQQEDREYTRSRNDRQDSLAEAKQAEEAAAKRAELGIVPDQFAPAPGTDLVNSFQTPTIRSAMASRGGAVGQFQSESAASGGQAPSVGQLPSSQLVAGFTDPSLGTKAQERQRALADARDTHAINRDYDLAHPTKSETAGGQNPMVVQRNIQNASNLRSQFNSDKTFTDGQIVATQLAGVKSALAQKTAGGDMAAVFGLMKVYDPSSSVREGEYATAKNAAGVPERLRNYFNGARDGRILDENQRRDFQATVENIAKGRRAALKGTMERYSKAAKAINVDPADVVFDPFTVFDAHDDPSGDHLVGKYNLTPKGGQ